MLRNEIKYVLTEAQASLLASRMRGLLAPDPHMGNPEGYLVSSLYFDDENDSAYFEKLAGAEHRSKYRVRTYGGFPEVVMLERKEKHGSKINKTSVNLDKSAFDKLSHGEFDILANYNSPLAHEVLALNRARRLMPKVVVTYLREAYVHPLSNTRITFDKLLNAGWGIEPENNAFAFPIAEFTAVGSTILEIKYDEYLPKHISAALSHSGPPLAASKYVLCRDKLASLEKIYTP
jgi:SPX domain-containing protein involved in vacuolar polyphosphate accumulation